MTLPKFAIFCLRLHNSAQVSVLIYALSKIIQNEISAINHWHVSCMLTFKYVGIWLAWVVTGVTNVLLIPLIFTIPDPYEK